MSEIQLHEDELDPAAVAYFEANPFAGIPFQDFTPEILEMARGEALAPPTREIAHVSDDEADGVRIRIYRDQEAPSGVVVYFHGGAHCIGSIGIMDGVARELTHHTGAAVVSVEYRLAPEHPFPAGLDDCEAVTRWALAHATELGASPDRVIAAGESAGGNMAAAVALRLQGDADVALAGQVLIYPGLNGDSWDTASRQQFDGIVITRASGELAWGWYSGGRDISRDPYAAPLCAPSLAGLPPALVILGGCDVLRDEGRAYASRLRDEGVAVEEVCYPGQPHGFVNFGLPAAEQAYERIGTWVKARFRSAGG